MNEIIIGAYDISEFVRAVEFEEEGVGFLAWNSETRIFFHQKARRLRHPLLDEMRRLKTMPQPVFIQWKGQQKLYPSSMVTVKDRSLAIAKRSSFSYTLEAVRDNINRIGIDIAAAAGGIAQLAAGLGWQVRQQNREIVLPVRRAEIEIRGEGLIPNNWYDAAYQRWNVEENPFRPIAPEEIEGGDNEQD